MYWDSLLILNQMEDYSIFSVVEKMGIFLSGLVLRNGNFNSNLDLRVIWPWLAGWIQVSIASQIAVSRSSLKIFPAIQ